MIETKYRAFISYNHRDVEKASWLQKRLEAYRVPGTLVGVMTGEGSVPRRLSPIFRDEECMAAGDLSDGVKEALKRSRFLIVVCSPEGAASDWVDREIRLFKELHGPGSDRRVLAAVVRGAGAEKEGDPLAPALVMPAACQLKVGADGALSADAFEPLAADLRFSARHASKGVLKLISGLIGVGLDDLLDRDHRRHRNYLRGVAAAAVSVAAVTGGLVFVAVDARNEAHRQRNEAEGLVEFMLTDLKQKLDAVGRLDALDSVGERALKYYAAQDKDRLDPDSLGRRARALLLVGEVDNLRGDLDAALAAYTEAAATTEEQLRRDPENAQRIFDHAQSVYWIGYIAMQRGDRPRAEKEFGEYLKFAERLVEIDPKKPEWRLEVAYANTNLGALAEKAGNFGAARDFFLTSVEIKRGLINETPNDHVLLRSLGQSLSWLARVELDTGEFLAAKSRLNEQLALYERLLGAERDNPRFLGPWCVAIKALSNIELAEGEVEAASQTLARAGPEINRLISAEPGNVEFQVRQARQLTQFAELESYRGNREESHRAAAAALAIIEQLRRQDPEVSEWRGDQIDALLALLKDIRHESAWAEYGPVLGALLGEEPAPLDPDLRAKAAKAFLVLGQREQYVAPNGAAGRSHFHKGIEAIEPVADRLGLAGRTLFASMLLRNDRKEEAEKIAAALAEINYRHPDFVELEQELHGPVK